MDNKIFDFDMWFDKVKRISEKEVGIRGETLEFDAIRWNDLYDQGMTPEQAIDEEFPNRVID